MWVASPAAIAFAQAFLPPETWVIWFNWVGFVVGVSCGFFAFVDYLWISEPMQTFQ